MRTRMRGGRVAPRTAHRRARTRAWRGLFWRRLDRPSDRLRLPRRAHRPARGRAGAGGPALRLRLLAAALSLEWGGAARNLRCLRPPDRLGNRVAQRVALGIGLPPGE